MPIQPKVIINNPTKNPLSMPKWIMQAISKGNHAKSQLTKGAAMTAPTRRRQPR